MKKKARDSVMRFDEILISKVNKVQLIDRLGSDANIIGTLHVTTSHIIFKADDTCKEIWVPNALINTVEKGTLSAAGCCLFIRCKHFLTLNLLVAKDKECQDLYETLCRCGHPVNISDVFAFENRERNRLYRRSIKDRGWDRFDWGIEFARQGVKDSSTWKETDFNISYKYCDTYPERLWVPRSAGTQVLIGSCKFRSRARLPVLTYWHRSNGSVISRCAQPLSGFTARCVEDEQLIDFIAKANPSCTTLYLIDTRPKVNAVVNKMQGKGFEDVRNYSNMCFYSFDIENIHVMRSSQQKLLDACQKAKTIPDYYKQLESSGWLRHIRSIIECAVFIVQSLIRGISCVVHCSDGWDRTSQTVSIAQLLIDPFFRTIRGFQILIEKDWLGFGHKFDDRCGHVAAFNEEAEKEVSPIFTQFLDAVFQLMRQRPRAFQFNERYLIEIHEQVYSCQYGTFLGNCDKDRKDLNLAKRTQSLWSFLDERHDDYLNPLYEHNKDTYIGDIDLHPSFFIVWIALYNRFDTGILPRESVNDVNISTLEHIGVLEAEINNLQARLAEMKKLSSESHCEADDTSMVDSGRSSSSRSTVEGSSDNTPMSVKLETVEENGVVNSKCSHDTMKINITQSESWKSESGICDSSSGAIEIGMPLTSIRWQSLRGADECSSKTCGAEFATRLERRLHCYRCGRLHCRRCVIITANEQERICSTCAILDC